MYSGISDSLQWEGRLQSVGDRLGVPLGGRTFFRECLSVIGARRGTELALCFIRDLLLAGVFT